MSIFWEEFYILYWDYRLLNAYSHQHGATELYKECWGKVFLKENLEYNAK